MKAKVNVYKVSSRIKFDDKHPSIILLSFTIGLKQ